MKLEKLVESSRPQRSCTLGDIHIIQAIKEMSAHDAYRVNPHFPTTPANHPH